MRRHIAGLHSKQQDSESRLDGIFLVRVARASCQWHRQKPFFELQFVVLEPDSAASRSFSGRLYCTQRALWKLNWFLTDFGHDRELLGLDQIDEKALVGLKGVVRVSHTTVDGRAYQNLDAFAPSADWEAPSCSSTSEVPRSSHGL